MAFYKTLPIYMKSNLIHIGLLLISSAVLCIELLQMRLLSFMLWHHLAYIVISMALLGFGAGGVCLAILRNYILPRWDTWLALAATFAGLSTVVAFAVISRVPLDTFDLSGWDYVKLPLYYVLLIIPFSLVGLSLSIIFTVQINHVSGIYFTNLVGSALGCYIFYIVIEPLGAPRALAIMATVLSIAGLIFVYRSKNLKLKYLILSVALIMAVSVILQDKVISVSPAGSKVLSEILTLKGAHIVRTHWTPIARIDVVEADQSPHPLLPGISSDSMKVITVDGDAQTYIYRRNDIKNGLTRPELFELTNYELAMFLKTEPDVLIIGPGGGHEIFVAHQMGASTVTGVELNKTVLELSRDTYSEFAGNIYQSPIAEPVVGEGRSFVRGSGRQFDVIQMTGVVTWAGLSSGAYVLSENYVYTVEAFRDLLSHLKDDGILAVSRFRLAPPRETLRVVSIAYQALKDVGAPDPSNNIVVMSLNPTLAMVLTKISPFTVNEIELLKSVVVEADGIIFYAPGVKTNTAYADLIVAFTEDRETEFFDEYEYNVAPVYDDRPFFFEYYKWSRFLDDFGRVDETYRGANRPVAITVLGSVLAMSILASIVLIVMPLALFRSNGHGLAKRWSEIAYFSLIGVAFMFVEISMMQRFVLFLGHPGYSIPVVLASLLVFAGIGSYCTNKIRLGLFTNLIISLLGIAIFLSLLLILQSLILSELMKTSLLTRVLATIAMIAPAGILMGMPFPLGLKVVSRISEHFIPWAWGINAVASVLGTILVVISAMALGFSWVIAISVLLYITALVTITPTAFLTRHSDVS